METYLNYITAFGGDNQDKVIAWAKSTLANHLKTNPEVQDEIEHILDYLLSGKAPKNIAGMAYAEVKKNTDKWNKALVAKGEHIKETARDIETILDFGDGFKIVKLIGKNAYEREGYLMRHCASSYFGKGKEVYSLRDSKNMPHATMEKNQQVKGKGNGDIHPNYVHYVVKFLEHIGMTVGDNEMEHLGYVNVEDILKKEPYLVFPELYNNKYFKKDLLPKVENRDRIALWGKFGLFNFGKDLEVSFNFDFEKCRNYLTEKLNKKTLLEKLGIKNVSKGSNNEVAMTNYNKVAMTNYNEVAMTYNNEVAMTNYNKVKCTEKNIIVGRAENKVECESKNVIVLGNNSKVKGRKGTLIVFYETDDDFNITNHKSVIIDGKKVKEDVWYTLQDGKFIEAKEIK
jgi:hypothetical protein